MYSDDRVTLDDQSLKIRTRRSQRTIPMSDIRNAKVFPSPRLEDGSDSWGLTCVGPGPGCIGIPSGIPRQLASNSTSDDSSRSASCPTTPINYWPTCGSSLDSHHDESSPRVQCCFAGACQALARLRID